MNNSAIVQFRENIKRIRTLSQTVSVIDSMTASAIDLSDILRSEIVLVVSALDYFVHEFVRAGMIDICENKRSVTDAYTKYQIPLLSAHLSQYSSSCRAWLEDAIIEKHSWQSFQEPDRIADAIRLISSVKLWEAVGDELGKSAKRVKATLKVIVCRRNQIAHEADMDPINPGANRPIDQKEANDAVDFIESTVEAIYKVSV